MPDILIVDDNTSFRKILSHILTSRFPAVDVREAKEGQTAFERVGTKVPDLVFMDVRLPGENGLKLTRRLKAAYPGVAVVMMTSFDAPEYQEAAFESGADAFLSKKSSTPEQIVDRVAAILAHRSA